MADKREEKNPKGETEKLMTVEDYLRENETVLTAFGIFIALTIFATGLPIKVVGAILSFLFLTLSIFIWLELWRKFPSQKGSLSLSIFENTLTITTLVLVGYWLLDYRKIWDKILPIPVFLLVATIISSILKKYNIFNRVFRSEKGKKRPLRYILGLIVVFVAIVMSFLISNLILPPLNKFLDQLLRYLINVKS